MRFMSQVKETATKTWGSVCGVCRVVMHSSTDIYYPTHCASLCTDKVEKLNDQIAPARGLGHFQTNGKQSVSTVQKELGRAQKL